MVITSTFDHPIRTFLCGIVGCYRFLPNRCRVDSRGLLPLRAGRFAQAIVLFLSGIFKIRFEGQVVYFVVFQKLHNVIFIFEMAQVVLGECVWEYFQALALDDDRRIGRKVFNDCHVACCAFGEM